MWNICGITVYYIYIEYIYIYIYVYYIPILHMNMYIYIIALPHLERMLLSKKTFSRFHKTSMEPFT